MQLRTNNIAGQLLYIHIIEACNDLMLFLMILLLMEW